MNSLSIVLLISALCAMTLAQLAPRASSAARRSLKLTAPTMDPNSMGFQCPTPLTPCPISAATNRSKTKVARGEPWECLDLQEELTSCGSCGTNCMDILHSGSVGCQAGSCKVFSCQPGYIIQHKMDAMSGRMVDSCV